MFVSVSERSPIISQFMDSLSPTLSSSTAPISPLATKQPFSRLLSLSPTFHYNMENVSVSRFFLVLKQFGGEFDDYFICKHGKSLLVFAGIGY